MRWLQAPARISPAAAMVVVCRRTAIAQLARRPVVLVVGGRYCAELGELSSLHMAQYSQKDWIWATSTFLRSIPPCFAVALAAQVLLSISLCQQMLSLSSRWYFSLDLIFSLCFLYFYIIVLHFVLISCFYFFTCVHGARVLFCMVTICELLRY